MRIPDSLQKILAIVLLLIGFVLLNHQRFGNQSGVYSYLEYVQEYIHEVNKQKQSKELADYIYSRIQYYQKLNTLFNTYTETDGY